MGEKTFSKKDANIYEDRTVIECPECAFEFSVIHDLSDKAGEYTCPNCEELRLSDENKRLREALEGITNIELDILVSDVWNEAVTMKKIARRALEGNFDE